MRAAAWAALVASALWLFARFGSSAALALAAGLLAIPVLSLPAMLVARRRLQLTLAVRDQSLRKGCSTAFDLSASGRSILPLTVNCKIMVQNQLSGRDAKHALTLPLGRSLSGTLGSKYSGRLRITLQRAWLCDCFGVLRIPVKCDQSCHVTVQPETFDMQLSLSDDHNDRADSEAYAPDRPGRDMTETFQLREYVPGDSPRQIHWKLSSKLDRLIVRDPGLPVEQDVLVFWERTGEAADEAVIDAQAEVLVTLCRALLEQTISFTIGWNEPSAHACTLHRIDDLDALVGILPKLLSVRGQENGTAGAGLLPLTRPDALCGHMVYLANTPAPEVEAWSGFGQLTVLTCGPTAPDHAIAFDAEQYAAQLGLLSL